MIHGEFKELKLTGYRGKYLVFFFYPLDFTFVCPTEMMTYGDRTEELRSIETKVVLCSGNPQSACLTRFDASETRRTGAHNDPAVSDLGHWIPENWMCIQRPQTTP